MALEGKPCHGPVGNAIARANANTLKTVPVSCETRVLNPRDRVRRFCCVLLQRTQFARTASAVAAKPNILIFNSKIKSISILTNRAIVNGSPLIRPMRCAFVESLEAGTHKSSAMAVSGETKGFRGMHPSCESYGYSHGGNVACIGRLHAPFCTWRSHKRRFQSAVLIRETERAY